MLIDYHPRPPIKNWPTPIFFYFVKIMFSGKFWCLTQVFIFQISFQVRHVTRRQMEAYQREHNSRAEETARIGNMQELYKITRMMSGKFTNSNVVKDQNGSILSKDGDIMKRWAEHFRSVLNRGNPTQLPIIDIDNDLEELDINIDEINVEEIKKAIKKDGEQQRCRN
jgi:hypothetical protein